MDSALWGHTKIMIDIILKVTNGSILALKISIAMINGENVREYE
jgi:hypothetical protein